MTLTRTPGGRSVVDARLSIAARRLGLSLALSLAACSDAGTRPDVEGETLRLGRVHVVLEPIDDLVANGEPTEGGDAQLEVSARFAFVRGLDEEFARARVGVTMLPHDALRPGECVPTDSLSLVAPEPEDSAEPRELVLVDAGDLSVRVGESDFEVPLSLVPDLLPYMSGVEYLHEGESLALAPASTPAVVVSAKGSMTDDLPPFATEGATPPSLGLFAGDAEIAQQRDGALVFRWAAPQRAEPITVRLLPLSSGEPVGDEITCVLADEGAARVDLRRLAMLGLPPQAEALRITASRPSVASFDVGEFTGTEFVVERRDRLVLPLLSR